MKVAILLLFSAMAAAQVPVAPSMSTTRGCLDYGPQDKHRPNVPDCKDPIRYTTATQTGFDTGPISTEVIAKDGHYRWTFDDPDNVYRCTVVSVVEPHNVFQLLQINRLVTIQTANAFMIACYLTHEPKKEK